jgi:hypothetical protein
MPTVNIYTGERVRKYWCIFAILHHLSMSSVPSSGGQYSCSLWVAAMRYGTGCGAFYTKLCHDLCEISLFYHDPQTTRCVSCDHAVCRPKLHFPQLRQFRHVFRVPKTLYLNQVDVIESRTWGLGIMQTSQGNNSRVVFYNS